MSPGGAEGDMAGMALDVPKPRPSTILPLLRNVLTQFGHNYANLIRPQRLRCNRMKQLQFVIHMKTVLVHLMNNHSQRCIICMTIIAGK
jgi:hypothetical protein